MEWVTLEEITYAYFDCRKRKRNKLSSLEYEINYEANNLKLYNELNDGSYKIGTSIAFCVVRPKLREVFAANFRDRIVHHLVINHFNYIFEKYMINETYSCRRGKGVMYGVNSIKKQIEEISENYTQECWVLKCDIQGFFMSIDKEILYNIIKKIIDDNYFESDKEFWLNLIKQIVMHRPELNAVKQGNLKLWEKLPENKSLYTSHGKGLPIGNLTSQIFANLYLSNFDKWVKEKVKDCGYGRYVDDFIIISKDKKRLLTFINEIKNYLESELKIILHPNKIYLQEAKKGVSFIGTTIKFGRKYTNNRTIGNIFNKIKHLNKNKIGIKDFLHSINSYFGFLIHNKTYGIRWKIWNLISQTKYYDIVGNLHHLKLK